MPIPLVEKHITKVLVGLCSGKKFGFLPTMEHSVHGSVLSHKQSQPAHSTWQRGIVVSVVRMMKLPYIRPS